jgi:NitT/TauT family transport system substrate-binding protein
MKKILLNLLVFTSVIQLIPDPFANAQEVVASYAELVETRAKVPTLVDPATYKMQDNTVKIELSEYAGYAGLIAANNGLEPNEESYFFRNHGFKVEIVISEDESWSELNAGEMAVSATTVDVLAAYGDQFKVVVPALIGYSRGATSLIVKKDIDGVQGLKGKVVATCQFTETDFLIRYFALEAGIPIEQLVSIDSRPNPNAINLLFCGDGFASGDLFARNIKENLNTLSGCVTWDPKTGEVLEETSPTTKQLASTANLLIVADILIVNQGFAKENPKVVDGLVDGLLAGNQLLKSNPAIYAPIVSSAFGWEQGEIADELKKVHLANLPENLAFFNGSIITGGSYSYLFETATEIYSPQLNGPKMDYKAVVYSSGLEVADKSGRYDGQEQSITYIDIEGIGEAPAPVLQKSIILEFGPNSAELDPDLGDNRYAIANLQKNLRTLMQIAPGSQIILEGHADALILNDFVKSPEGQRPESAKKISNSKLTLRHLSERRCESLKQFIITDSGVDKERITAVGRGVDVPTGRGPEHDRRVEVQWILGKQNK